ncbi:MAG: rRNA maturation RNase YbeY [Actinomycetota bacterium]
MNVFVANEQDRTIDVERSAALARHALRAEKLSDETELSVLYVTADHMRKLNHRYAGHDYATDVLAFPLMEEDEEEGYLLGDVVICPEVAATNAEKIGHSLSEELDTLLVHGTLHLLGYDHQGAEDKAKMDGRMAELLKSFEEPEDE